jgi:hypothetical protein
VTQELVELRRASAYWQAQKCARAPHWPEAVGRVDRDAAKVGQRQLERAGA